MLQAGVLLAEARSTFFKPNIAAMEAGTFGLFATTSIIPRLADLLASFDLADGLEGVALDLPLPLGRRFRLSGTLAGTGLDGLHQGLNSRGSPLQMGVTEGSVQGPLARLATANISRHLAPGKEVVALQPGHSSARHWTNP